ncbi:unnamed protein product [Arctogadus glacialis]
MCVEACPSGDFFLDSRCFETRRGFDQRYTALLRDLAQRINPGEWTERTGYHFELTLYVALDAQFDYTIAMSVEEPDPKALRMEEEDQ